MRTREEQIEKIIEAMKDYTLLHTYGDDGHGYPLIDALTPEGKTIDVGKSECGELAAELYDSVIAPHILEAERRAEQRVRAEIGRPVYQFKSGVSYWTDTTEVFYRARVQQGQETRKLYRAEAIDAAREVGRWEGN